mmetsp:Transcript_54541/g.122087  ORF Transcript_54541/g.122087 Transcript_54541/m.122087 type:complete len:227 (-) Transcript_54541:1700-2380(-)
MARASTIFTAACRKRLPTTTPPPRCSPWGHAVCSSEAAPTVERQTTSPRPSMTTGVAPSRGARTLRATTSTRRRTQMMGRASFPARAAPIQSLMTTDRTSTLTTDRAHMLAAPTPQRSTLTRQRPSRMPYFPMAAALQQLRVAPTRARRITPPRRTWTTGHATRCAAALCRTPQTTSRTLRKTTARAMSARWVAQIHAQTIMSQQPRPTREIAFSTDALTRSPSTT